MIREILAAALYALGAGVIVLVTVLVTGYARTGPEFPPLPRDEEN